jgi:8-oxo-dGTP pyrophosphatase MutT (NUDIX family)
MPHIHDKIDFTASAYIVCRDKVLLRFHEKIKLWLAPGGHIELDEDPVETVVKEAKEEVGLDIKIVADPVMQFNSEDHDYGRNLQIPMFINRHRINPNHEHIDLIYAAETNTMDINPAEGEASDPNFFRWVTKEQLDQLEDVHESVKFYATTALNKVQNQ